MIISKRILYAYRVDNLTGFCSIIYGPEMIFKYIIYVYIILLWYIIIFITKVKCLPKYARCKYCISTIVQFQARAQFFDHLISNQYRITILRPHLNIRRSLTAEISTHFKNTRACDYPYYMPTTDDGTL